MSNAAGGVQAKPDSTLTRQAARDLSSYQYHAMKQTNQTFDYADSSSGDMVMGVLQNNPDTTGKEAEIATGGTTLLYVDANSPNIAVGDHLGSNSNFHGVQVTGDDAFYFAIAMEAATADGDIIEAKLVGPSYISGSGDD